MSNIRLTIFRKGLLLISLPLLFQYVIVATLLHVQRDATDAEKWATHSKDVLTLAQSSINALARAQSAARAVVITKQEDFSKQTDTYAATVEADFEQLIALVSDNPAQQAKAQRVRDLSKPLIAWLKDQAALAMAGRDEDAAEHVRSHHGVNLMADVQREFDEFRRRELQLASERSEELARTRSQQRWALAVGVVASTIVTCLAVYIFGKSIASRVSVVTENAKKLASNKPLLPPVPGSDEVFLLDSALHDAANRLAEATEVERRYKLEVERRAEELGRANESLRQQTVENEMFVYSVSHDLRSPLVNLQGFSRELMHAGEELTQIFGDERVPTELRKKLDTILEQDVIASVKFIQTAVSRSSAIIDSLLRLSRAGRVEYRLVDVDVAVVIRRVIDAMASTIQERKATLVVHKLLKATGDATAVDQIFGNLVGNAVNYLDPQRPGRIEIGMVNEGEPDGGGLRTYYVRDNGLGIPEAYLSKVFVAFQRLHGDAAKGEGIGLALVRRMIERHGGRAWVESAVGVGTTFFVALPAAGVKSAMSAGENPEQLATTVR